MSVQVGDKITLIGGGPGVDAKSIDGDSTLNNALPSKVIANPAAGFYVRVSADGTTLEGSDISAIVGPPGENGEPGTPGAKGIDGEIGLPGGQGSAGERGGPGTPGNTGIDGGAGDDGHDGVDGDNAQFPGGEVGDGDDDGANLLHYPFNDRFVAASPTDAVPRTLLHKLDHDEFIAVSITNADPSLARPWELETDGPFDDPDAWKLVNPRTATNSVYEADTIVGKIQTITEVVIADVTGEFTCTATNLQVGNRVTITGTLIGSGDISDYESGKVYRVSSVTGSSPAVTGFTLITEGGADLVTTTGTSDGLLFTTTIEPYYVCILGHTAAVDNEPGVGGDEAEFWAQPEWVLHNRYEIGNLVGDVQYYNCILGHVADEDSEPGIGVDWETYWVGTPSTEHPTEYAAGRNVQHDDRFFTCRTRHHAFALAEPGSGEYALRWTLKHKYLADDIMFDRGLFYIALSDHISLEDETREGHSISQPGFERTLSDVVATDTAGAFSCSAGILAVNDLVTVTGFLSDDATGEIVAYESATIYKVASLTGVSPNVTEFVLTTDDDNPIVTVAGTLDDLVFTINVKWEEIEYWQKYWLEIENDQDVKFSLNAGAVEQRFGRKVAIADDDSDPGFLEEKLVSTSADLVIAVEDIFDADSVSNWTLQSYTEGQYAKILDGHPIIDGSFFEPYWEFGVYRCVQSHPAFFRNAPGNPYSYPTNISGPFVDWHQFWMRVDNFKQISLTVAQKKLAIGNHVSVLVNDELFGRWVVPYETTFPARANVSGDGNYGNVDVDFGSPVEFPILDNNLDEVGTVNISAIGVVTFDIPTDIVIPAGTAISIVQPSSVLTGAGVTITMTGLLS